ncbi:hypothetical protein RHGRI_018012 [Rhododendron griersonianum]|uniref:Transmembrane protein n=1 Tax=Rhododendron griersonianum TaxID=479676 RepID=A0AAV6K024_9ERIC|nr:hypothetical protein RHGRI_018012 [Rhododendron griersonianum]
MGSKAIVFLGLFLAIVLLFTSGVTAKDLAETSTSSEFMTPMSRIMEAAVMEGDMVVEVAEEDMVVEVAEEDMEAEADVVVAVFEAAIKINSQLKRAMGFKALVFVGLFLAIVLLITSEVTARDLAETSTSTSEFI